MRIFHLLFSVLAVSAVTLTACSADDHSTEPTNSSGNRQIRFAAATDLTRGDLTTNNLKAFNVYAYTGSATHPTVFMNNVTVTKNATNVWTYSPVKYWPAHEAVDFYAFAPSDWLDSATPIMPVPYDNIEGLTDLIYAVSPNLTGYSDSPNAQVLFNFRHALAKVSVKLSSTNPDIQVRVSNVVIANISTRGNFHFPALSTAGSVTPNSTGYWNDLNTPYVYMYHMAQSPEDVIILTSTPNDLSDPDAIFGGPKYMIPQRLIWNNNGSGSDTYLTVMCSVYDAHTGTKIWPNANTPNENVVEGSTFGDGLLKFPLSTTSFNEWQAGNHYIYSVVINSNSEMGAIEFGDPSVDTYVDIDVNYH